ncbi:MAG: Gfo/Idh/MocA family oxidoreductase [Acidobacteriota bacterium]|nr:Gfo/Idh/MocA family oxidoreductase [Acidobacteriota bacterium]
MPDKVKVGVLGVGALGRHHARLYTQCDQADLVGVYDLNEETGRRVAEEVGTTFYDQVEDLADRVEGISIAVPTNLHHKVGLEMLAKKKHLLLEKPITETVDQARALLKEAEDNDLIVQVGHVERFNPVISYLEQKADNPRFIESHRMAPYPPPRPGLPPRGTEVSVVLDLMIHDIDMVLSLVRSPIVDVDAVGIPVLSPTEDIANARLRFENGCVANLTASRVTPEPMRKIRLFQRNCYLSLDYMAKAGEIYTRDERGIHREPVPVDDHNALLKELEDFVSCVAHLRETGEMAAPKVTGLHGMQALEVAEQVIDKIRLVNPL